MGRYLIVEDDDAKYESINRALVEIGIRKEDVEHAPTVNAATILLRSNLYELLILDLNLPMVSGGKPVENGGVTLLNKLKNSSYKYNLPSKIIGLTSYPGLKNNYEDQFASLCFAIYDYERIEWKDALSNAVNWSIQSNASSRRVSGKKILLSVHGIRTLGKWQDELENMVIAAELDYEVKKYRYNYFSAFQLAIPYFRTKVIQRLSKELEHISDHNPDSTIVVLSHSFGTYAVTKALEILPKSCDLKIDKLCFVSSVLKSSYNFEDIKRRFKISSVINECGIDDNVLILSHYLCWDMGMAGRTGFVGTEVVNRYYKGGHDFFNRESDFIDLFWIPIFRDELDEHNERDFGYFRENIEIILTTKFVPVILFMVIFVYILKEDLFSFISMFFDLTY
ncbi:response regulator [Corallincola luteus]|uniref:Response regulator n=1 Tax=Corallincola luteus TaxID=1775177 RepID=A0ABY2AP02_9GAMM|nr:response regulator [Corallincola luteus]TCI04925.1 response regulator [Corallincola luteus]